MHNIYGNMQYAYLFLVDDIISPNRCFDILSSASQGMTQSGPWAEGPLISHLPPEIPHNFEVLPKEEDLGP